MESLEASIAVYEEQLKQVEATILATSPNSDEELLSLKNDLQQLIDLSKQNLLELKKQQLLEEIEQVEKQQEKSAGNSSEKTAVQLSPALAPRAEDGESSCSVIDTASLVGNKCSAPFRNVNGVTSFHNAIIFSAEQEIDSVQVQVVYSHPTQLSMVPCKFYMSGSCKFSSEKCKYSHGQDHNFLDLGEFKEPDYSQIKSNREGTQLLALDTDCGLWKHATLVQYEDDQKVHVRFDQSSLETRSLDQVLPLSGDDHEESSDDDEDDFAPLELAVQVALEGGGGCAALGGWESSTKGIGSKLMSQMGYVHGAGLGKCGQGLVEPVPVVVYPTGKSLDWCMNAKAATGCENDPKGVIYLDKKRKIQAGMEQAKVKASAAATRTPKTDVFDIINTKLQGGGGGDGAKNEGLQLSKELLQKPSSSGAGGGTSRYSQQAEDKRKLNMENLKTMEKLQKNQKEIEKVEGSLRRATNRGDRAMLDQKLKRLKSVRDQLKSHEKNVESSLYQRSKRKLEIF